MKINYYVMQILTEHSILLPAQDRDGIRRRILVAGVVGTTWMMSSCYLSAPDGWWEKTALESEMGG